MLALFSLFSCSSVKGRLNAYGVSHEPKPKECVSYNCPRTHNERLPSWHPHAESLDNPESKLR